MRRLVPFAALLLSACGLHPLYSGGGSGRVGSTLGQIEVAPIPGQSGYLVSNAVRDQLGATTGGTPLYRLEIKLDDKIIGLGVRRNDTVTRERRTLRARYQLIDLSNGTVLLDGSAGSDAGIDVVGSEYATIAGENTALERLSTIVAGQIVSRIALYTERTARQATQQPDR